MKKIMFNDRYGLTQAVLDGRKTMTRRGIRNVPMITFYSAEEFHLYDKLEDKYHQVNAIYKYAQYQVGEVVAIAQSYNNCLYDAHTEIEIDGKDYLMCETKGWDNKMFVKAELMPHHIRITNIRVERLQDISDEDCLREGVRTSQTGKAYYTKANESIIASFLRPIYAFQYLIDRVSGKGTWESNPYVFVYEFELVD